MEFTQMLYLTVKIILMLSKSFCINIYNKKYALNSIYLEVSNINKYVVIMRELLVKVS